MSEAGNRIRGFILDEMNLASEKDKRECREVLMAVDALESELEKVKGENVNLDKGLEVYDKRHDADQAAIKLCLKQRDDLRSQLQASEERVATLKLWKEGAITFHPSLERMAFNQEVLSGDD